MAKITYIDPILHIQGTLGKGNRFYSRVLHGNNILQTRPDRSHQHPSPAQLECRRRFVAQFAQHKTKPTRSS